MFRILKFDDDFVYLSHPDGRLKKIDRTLFDFDIKLGDRGNGSQTASAGRPRLSGLLFLFQRAVSCPAGGVCRRPDTER